MAGVTLAKMMQFVKSGKKITTRKQLSQVRDALVRQGPKVLYYVWGNRIATMNLRSRTLSVSSAGWETNLTKDRLNKILPKGYIFQKRFKWFYKTNGKVIPFRGNLKVKI